MNSVWNLPHFALLAVREGRVLRTNAELARVCPGAAGTPPPDETWARVLGLDDAPAALAWWMAATRAERPRPRVAAADRGKRWLRLRAHRDPAAPASGESWISVEDITEEHLAFERMRLTGEHFHALIERSSEGISVFDVHAKILYESPSNKRIHGYDAEEMEGRSLFDFCHPDDMARVMPRFVHLAEGPGVVETEIVRFRHKAGHYIYLEGTVLNATDDPRVGGLVNNFREVTARLEAERELRRAKEAAEQAQRLQQHWLTNLSHEFKTPLTLIRGPLTDLAGGKLPARQQKQAWEMVRRNIDSLDGLLTELVDLARLEAGAFSLRARQHELVGWVRRRLATVASTAEARRIALRLDAPIECPVFFDSGKLEKVLGNFLSNALKFSADGTTIRVSIMRHANEEGDGTAEVSVTDEGPGMDAATCARVFERFFQGHAGLARAHQGMGIGLAIAREIVEMHGGSVRATSQEGVGSTFTFSLNLGCDHLDPDEIDTSEVAEPRPHSVGARPSVPPAGNGPSDRIAEESRPRLLLVEDNHDMRAYLRMHLDSSYVVQEANNGQEAWALRDGNLPDVVLSDVMMPHVDGLELCRRIKADPRWQAVPVVLLSAKGQVDQRVEGLAAGADDYLAKPFSVVELLQRLRSRLPKSVLEVPSGGEWWTTFSACLDENLASPDFDVEMLAAKVGYSSRQLRRRVLEHTGRTPAMLLLERRLKRAHEAILARRFETIAEVAHSVGLSPGYFSRRYRQTYACAEIRL